MKTLTATVQGTSIFMVSSFTILAPAQAILGLKIGCRKYVNPFGNLTAASYTGTRYHFDKFLSRNIYLLDYRRGIPDGRTIQRD